VFTENVCYTTRWLHVAPLERFIRVIFAGYSTRGKREERGFALKMSINDCIIAGRSAYYPSRPPFQQWLRNYPRRDFPPPNYRRYPTRCNLAVGTVRITAINQRHTTRPTAVLDA